jgi:hypothetical protein
MAGVMTDERDVWDFLLDNDDLTAAERGELERRMKAARHLKALRQRLKETKQ